MGDLNHIASIWFISGSCEQYLIVPTADGKEPFLEQVFNLLGNFLELMAGKNISNKYLDSESNVTGNGSDLESYWPTFAYNMLTSAFCANYLSKFGWYFLNWIVWSLQNMESYCQLRYRLMCPQQMVFRGRRQFEYFYEKSVWTCLTPPTIKNDFDWWDSCASAFG